jgi:hypothetical protein
MSRELSPADASIAIGVEFRNQARDPVVVTQACTQSLGKIALLDEAVAVSIQAGKPLGNCRCEFPARHDPVVISVGGIQKLPRSGARVAPTGGGSS